MIFFSRGKIQNISSNVSVPFKISPSEKLNEIKYIVFQKRYLAINKYQIYFFQNGTINSFTTSNRLTKAKVSDNA